MTQSAPNIDALSDTEAIRLLALVIDQTAALPDLAEQRRTETHLREAAEADAGAGSDAVNEGDLARATLRYLEIDPVRAQSVRRAAAIFVSTDRFDPGTVAVGVLVVLALQTEVKVARDERGKWTFQIHKRAMRDSALVSLINKVISFYQTPR